MKAAAVGRKARRCLPLEVEKENVFSLRYDAKSTLHERRSYGRTRNDGDPNTMGSRRRRKFLQVHFLKRSMQQNFNTQLRFRFARATLLVSTN